MRDMAHPAIAREANHVLTLEEIGNLTQEGGKPAETLMNVVALIARRFQTDVCSAYLAGAGPRQPGAGRHSRTAPRMHRHSAHGDSRKAWRDWWPSRFARSPWNR